MTMVASGAMENPAARAGRWWRPFATTAGISVALIDLKPHPVHEAEAYSWLDSGERASWGKYLPGPRRRFALCRAALRAVLCSLLHCRNEELAFGASRHGKPFAVVGGAESSVGFNVSHSGAYGLIAWSVTGRLGVDIEERAARRSLDLLIEEVMGPDEQDELAALQGTAQLEYFYRLWTCKEALIKALGTGLATAPSQFQVPSAVRWGATRGTFSFPHVPAVTWGLEEMGNERFAAALAYEIRA